LGGMYLHQVSSVSTADKISKALLAAKILEQVKKYGTVTEMKLSDPQFASGGK